MDLEWLAGVNARPCEELPAELKALWGQGAPPQRGAATATR